MSEPEKLELIKKIKEMEEKLSEAEKRKMKLIKDVKELQEKLCDAEKLIKELEEKAEKASPAAEHQPAVCHKCDALGAVIMCLQEDVERLKGMLPSQASKKKAH